MYLQLGSQALQVTCGKGNQKKLLFRSLIVYYKNLSSQCNLSAQIEQLQDKYRLNLFLDTSRAPREGEVHGKGYYFTDRETMDEQIKEGKYIEWGEFNGNIYGTKLESIHDVTMNGKMCVLDVSPTVSYKIIVSDL